MMKRIEYEATYSIWLFVAPLLASLAGFSVAAFLLLDPLDPALWLDTIRQSSAYIAGLIRYAIAMKSMQPLKEAHLQTVIFFVVTICIPTISLLIAALYAGLKPSQTRNISKFANPSEVRRMKLYGDLGPILGIYQGKLLKAPEPRHVIGIAPTRSGKTRQVITSVLDWPGTVVVVDPKREIKQITTPYREKIGPTHTIGFADPKSPSGWNPFAVANLPTDTVEIELKANRLASLLAPANPKATDTHWDDTAMRNMTALCALQAYSVLHSGKDGHLANLLLYLTDLPAVDDEDAFALKMNQLAAHAAHIGAPDWVQRDLISFANIEARERSSHISSLLTKLQVFRGEATRQSLGQNSFSMDDLRDRPSTVFIDFPREDARAFGPITALFLDALFTHALSNGRKEGEYPILVIMDEFRDLPVIPNLIPLMTAGAGAGITAYILVQGLTQLQERYPDSWRNIQNNAEYTILFENPDGETQKIMTEIVGQTEKNKKSENTNSLGWVQSKNQQKQTQDLIAKSDWGVIKFGHHVLLARRHQIRPVYCQSAFWDQIPEIRRRVPKKNRIRT